MTSGYAMATARINQVRQHMSNIIPKRQNNDFLNLLSSQLLEQTSVQSSGELISLLQNTLQQNSGISYESLTNEEKYALKNVDKYSDIIEEAAKKYNLNPSLIRAIIDVESDFRPNLVSSAGAQGLMQLMPSTAKDVGVTDRFDPRENIMGATEYISKQLKRFQGDIKLTLAGYSRGPNAISKLGITPNATDPNEYLKLSSGAQGYVNKVLRMTQVYELAANMKK